jgi:hypothetical protein
MEHWIGYYAAFVLAVTCFAVVVQISRGWPPLFCIIMGIGTPLPLILHAWGVL